MHHAASPHLFQVAKSFYAAVLQHQHFIGKMKDLIQRVADVEHGDINLPRQPLQIGQQLPLAGDVERGQGFIQQQQFGCGEQRTADGDPLLLSSRQGRRQAIEQRLNP